MTLSASSALFYWSSRFGSIAPIGGRPTCVRNSIAKFADKAGIYADAIINTPPFEWATVGNERRRVAMLTRSRKNLCLQSENFSSTWVNNGTTPTLVAAAHTLAGVTLDLLGDDSASLAEGFQQNIAFTGNGTKSLIVHIRQGSATKSFWQLVDLTAVVTRFSATVSWSGGQPSVVTTGGSYWGAIALADGVFRLLFTMNSITAANSNQFLIYPAYDGSDGTLTGTTYLGGVMIDDDAGVPYDYIKTTSATVTRSAVTLSYDYAASPQALMVYSRIVERGTYLNGGSRRVWQIGKADNSSPQLCLFIDTSRYALFHHNGTSSVISSGNGVFTDHGVGNTIEHVAVLGSDGKATLHESIDGAAVQSAAQTAGLTLAAAWTDKLFWLNGVSTNCGENQFAEVKIVKSADIVSSTATDIMNELRAFQINEAGQLVDAGT